MTATDDLRALAAIALAASFPVAFVLLAIWSQTRESTLSANGRTLFGRLFAWAGGLSLASTAVLLVLL